MAAQNVVGVNPDPKESNLDVIPADVLALWQGNGGAGRGSDRRPASGGASQGPAEPSGGT